MEVPWLVAVGDNEGLLPDLRLGQLDEVEEPPESDIPRGVRPEPFVARVFPSREVEERIPPRAAEGDERVLDGGPDLALAPRLACADALARACLRARG